MSMYTVQVNSFFAPFSNFYLHAFSFVIFLLISVMHETKGIIDRLFVDYSLRKEI